MDPLEWQTLRLAIIVYSLNSLKIQRFFRLHQLIIYLFVQIINCQIGCPFSFYEKVAVTFGK